MTASQENAATPSPDGAGGTGRIAVLTDEPLLEVRDVAKYFGSVNALQGISLKVYAGEVTCVLGDNGAGKSTLIKILSGVFPPDEGEFLIEGKPISLAGPREARARGIATVFQDLATVPLMSLWRNFFLGQEPTTGRGPLRRLNSGKARTIMRSELAKMGIDVRDPNQNVGTLSGGERQALAIARAVYFGARVLILDEPTSALGVRQSGIVLKYIVQAREMGKGVIFITHNPHHAYPVGNRFYLLKRGRLMASLLKDETTIEGLTDLMAGAPSWPSSVAGAHRGRRPPRAGAARGDRDAVRVPPHAESHVETDEQIRRFLADTDPELVGLCLDTGHVAYAQGDAPRLLREHAGRIWYVHLKAVDPGVLAQVQAERLSFADAVKRDVMCEPGRGVPALGDVTAALGSLPAGTFVIVEQDLYPCDFDRPYPIAARTRRTLRAAGIG